MWPMLLNLTRDECRLTLRRLELEAYSNMVNVFRAQGALEDNRKKLLEELRAVLHISHDRHNAEARRVSNDQLLATIADQLSGPNTGLGWINEGRRRVPLLPRGIPQTAYTEIADKAAELATTENIELQKRLEEKMVAPKLREEDMGDAEVHTADALNSSEAIEELMCPPIAMEDQTLKLWDTELITRKRKVPEDGVMLEEVTIPIKSMRNITVNTNQKHLDLTQLYSKFSQPATSKPPSQSKHSYNQVSKVSTSKSNQPHAPRSVPQKSRAPKTPKTPKAPRQTKGRASTKRKSQEIPLSPGKPYNPVSMQLDYAGPPNTFQASYAQSVLGGKPKSEFDDIKSTKVMSSAMMVDSPTMQLLTQPATVSDELQVPKTDPDDVSTLQAQSAPSPIHVAPKQFILKGRGEVTPDTKPSEVKVLQNPMEGIKVLSNRQVLVASSSAQKALTAPPQKVMSTPGKLVTTKVIGSVPKNRTPSTPIKTEQMIVVPKPTPDSRNLASSRLIVTSAVSTAMRERTSESASTVARLTESLTPKGIPATDLKVSAKALVIHPKGQKMVVLPAKARTKSGNEHERKIPLIHFKGIPTAMKLVPVSQSVPQSIARSSTVTVLSKPAVSSLPSTPKVIGMEPIKTANLADIVPVKGLTPVSTSKITNPILRPSSAKGNVIVVQKGTPIGKALSFAKNGNDMSKIIMGKNVTQLLQASKTEHAETGKPPGNVIVLELNNEQSGRPTTMSEILDSRGSSAARLSAEKKPPQITAETPVLFDTQLTEETCNTSSLDSTTDSIPGIVPLEVGALTMDKDETKSEFGKQSEGAKDSEHSSVTDWEMELDTVSRKDKDEDKLNSLHLDLGMSSDSEGEYMGTGRKRKGEHSAQPRRPTPTSGESSGVFSSSSAMSLATRTLLSQLQDEGSSSNDSSFALKTKVLDRTKHSDVKLDKVECDELTKAKEKLSEKVADARSQRRRIDVYSTAIAPSDINLDSFYLEEAMLAGDHALDDQMRRLLGEDCASADSPVSETLNK